MNTRQSQAETLQNAEELSVEAYPDPYCGELNTADLQYCCSRPLYYPALNLKKQKINTQVCVISRIWLNHEIWTNLQA